MIIRAVWIATAGEHRARSGGLSYVFHQLVRDHELDPELPEPVHECEIRTTFGDGVRVRLARLARDLGGEVVRVPRGNERAEIPR
jgi:hypothetical protein